VVTVGVSANGLAQEALVCRALINVEARRLALYVEQSAYFWCWCWCGVLADGGPRGNGGMNLPNVARR